MSAEIAAEIDWEVMSTILGEMGWTKVTTKSSKYSPDDCYEILTWVKGNCKGKNKCRGNTWMFESAKDAQWFSLRWSHE